MEAVHPQKQTTFLHPRAGETRTSETRRRGTERATKRRPTLKISARVFSGARLLFTALTDMRPNNKSKQSDYLVFEFRASTLFSRSVCYVTVWLKRVSVTVNRLLLALSHNIHRSLSVQDKELQGLL